MNQLISEKPADWIWSEILPEYKEALQRTTELYFYDRYICSLDDERFKRFFTSCINLYGGQFLNMYNIQIKEFDPSISRTYSETVKDLLDRKRDLINTLNNIRTNDLTNTDTINKLQTNNLTDNETKTHTQTNNLSKKNEGASTQTNNLKDTTVGTNTQTNNTTQEVNYTGDDTTMNSHNTTRTDNLTNETNGYDRTLASDTPQSMVNPSTSGNPENISWEYASGLSDNIRKNRETNKGTVQDDGTDDSTVSYNSTDTTTNTGTIENSQDVTRNSTGTITHDQNLTELNTGTVKNDETNNSTNSGTIKNEDNITSKNTGTITDEGSNNEDETLKDTRNIVRDITETNEALQDLYIRYYKFVDRSNAFMWIRKKIELCFLSIFKEEDESEGWCFIP